MALQSLDIIRRSATTTGYATPDAKHAFGTKINP